MTTHETPQFPVDPPRRTSGSDRPPFLIRPAGGADLAYVGKWLPEALIGTPLAKLLIAADAATFGVAGVAALRGFADQVGRFQIYVEPSSRRRGCGAALLDAVRETALQAGVKSLMTVQSYEVTANDDASNAARAFFQARGLAVAQEIRRCRVDLKSALAVLEPLYQRFMRRTTNPQAVTIVPAAQVDTKALAAFAVRHVGGIPEVVAQRLKGVGDDAYTPTLSVVALADNQIVGALLSVPLASNEFLVETRVVDPGHRRGGLNLALMYRAAAGAVAAGGQTIDFEHDTQESDTAKLVGRLGAIQVGCRQCWGVALPVQAPAASAPAAPGQNALARLSPPIGGEVRGLQAPAPLPGLGQGGQVQSALRAAHTANFPALLRELGVSLLVTTRQAGKLVLVRAEGDRLNAHVRTFPAPMGLAVFEDGDRLAIGAKAQVWEFVNVPAVAAKLEPPGRHDACYLPRASHVTGDIQMHDMAWGAGGELWVVNTRFSCLCTLDRSASFRPRWRPPFISALEPSDRCHLNGLALVGGKPKFATALGETNTPSGWRDNKARGGIVIDVDAGAVLARAVSLPHSPRWHADRLWICEAGAGTLGFVDPNTGRYTPVAETPGFPRGLDFAGPFAFVGLSQVRENAVFSGIALSKRLAAHERTCGICVIDLRSSQVVALLRFEAGAQEVFALAVLGRRFPELINDDEKLLEGSFVIPTECLGEVAGTTKQLR